MVRLLSSLLIGGLLFLGNLSSQAKSYKILDHVVSDHSAQPKPHTHHGNHHHHVPAKSKRSPASDHHHDAELASLNVPMNIPAQGEYFAIQDVQKEFVQIFLSANQLSLSSFSSSIFRPPIA